MRRTFLIPAQTPPSTSKPNQCLYTLTPQFVLWLRRHEPEVFPILEAAGYTRIWPAILYMYEIRCVLRFPRVSWRASNKFDRREGVDCAYLILDKSPDLLGAEEALFEKNLREAMNRRSIDSTGLYDGRTLS